MMRELLSSKGKKYFVKGEEALHTLARTHTHTHTHARAHTHAHTHMHAHMRTHTVCLDSSLSLWHLRMTLRASIPLMPSSSDTLPNVSALNSAKLWSKPPLSSLLASRGSAPEWVVSTASFSEMLQAHTPAQITQHITHTHTTNNNNNNNYTHHAT